MKKYLIISSLVIAGLFAYMAYQYINRPMIMPAMHFEHNGKEVVKVWNE